MELMSLRDVADWLQISEKRATKILQMPGCPILPRAKGDSYLVVKEALERWLENGCPES